MIAIRMPNGVTVSDWLGTAAVSARSCSRYCEEMREGLKQKEHYPTVLNHAISEAQQALDELKTIQRFIETGK